jgi:hypothetical protein
MVTVTFLLVSSVGLTTGSGSGSGVGVGVLSPQAANASTAAERHINIDFLNFIVD